MLNIPMRSSRIHMPRLMSIWRIHSFSSRISNVQRRSYRSTRKALPIFDYPILLIVTCSEEDIPYFGPDLPQLCNERLVPDEEGFFHAHYRYRPYPAKHVSIRSTDDETYHVVDVTDGRNKILEEIEWARAIFELYEGAIFMHQGQSFMVKELSHDRKMARLERTNVEWTTRQRDFT